MTTRYKTPEARFIARPFIGEGLGVDRPVMMRAKNISEVRRIFGEMELSRKRRALVYV